MAESSVGDRIRTVRNERGWTQDALAAAVGVSRSAVAQWETDRAGQVRTNLSRVAAALGVSVEYLLHGVNLQPAHGAQAGALPGGLTREHPAPHARGAQPSAKTVLADPRICPYLAGPCS